MFARQSHKKAGYFSNLTNIWWDQLLFFGNGDIFVWEDGWWGWGMMEPQMSRKRKDRMTSKEGIRDWEMYKQCISFPIYSFLFLYIYIYIL